jgi:hypothetical protein
MKATIDLDVGRKTFVCGLLPELIAALRRNGRGHWPRSLTPEHGLANGSEC